MNKTTALKMLTGPPEEVTFIDGVQLDILKNEKLFMNVGMFKSFEQFIITFDTDDHAQFNKLFFKAKREEITQSRANIFVHNLACTFSSEIISTMAKAMLEYRRDDQEDFSTTYIGAGIPACFMAMVAAISPPHQLFSFGMPAFSSMRVFNDIQEKAYDRKMRIGNHRELAIDQNHYILPTDGTFRVSTDYSSPTQKLTNHTCPTYRERLLARLTTFPRRGLNLKHHENTPF
tara:strand:- start:421 stop:1116 length:696 start_codon:yes stop_codon:yes gene_type:complete